MCYPAVVGAKSYETKLLFNGNTEGSYDYTFTGPIWYCNKNIANKTCSLVESIT